MPFPHCGMCTKYSRRLSSEVQLTLGESATLGLICGLIGQKQRGTSQCRAPAGISRTLKSWRDVLGFRPQRPRGWRGLGSCNTSHGSTNACDADVRQCSLGGRGAAASHRRCGRRAAVAPDCRIRQRSDCLDSPRPRSSTPPLLFPPDRGDLLPVSCWFSMKKTLDYSLYDIETLATVPWLGARATLLNDRLPSLNHYNSLTRLIHGKLGI